MSAMKRVVMAQKVRLHDADRTFDIAFWQAQPSAARFRAAWEMVQHAHRPRSGSEPKPHILCLQRNVVSRKRLRDAKP